MTLFIYYLSVAMSGIWEQLSWVVVAQHLSRGHSHRMPVTRVTNTSGTLLGNWHEWGPSHLCLSLSLCGLSSEVASGGSGLQRCLS